MSSIVAEHLWLEYRNERTGAVTAALQDISFSVADGEFVSIVGPSGCGKTTLLRCVARLLRATAGQVLLDGYPVTKPGPHLGFVFQSPLLLPWRTALANISYGPELAGRDRRETGEQARRLIELVGLSGFEHSYPHELSGGMQQRVNLARALALEPKALVLDEPFSSLDAQTREFMQEELQRIWLAKRMTSLFVTHQISEAVYLADRVVVLSARPGRVREEVLVPLPHPRPLSIKRTPEFRAIEDYVWSLIEAESRLNWRQTKAEG